MILVGLDDPLHQRVPLVLFHFEEMSYEEIARRLEASLPKIKTDLNEAKKLLAEAGYKGEEIVIITNSSYQSMYKAAQVVAEQLKAAGFNKPTKTNPAGVCPYSPIPLSDISGPAYTASPLLAISQSGNNSPVMSVEV